MLFVSPPPVRKIPTLCINLLELGPAGGVEVETSFFFWGSIIQTHICCFGVSVIFLMMSFFFFFLFAAPALNFKLWRPPFHPFDSFRHFPVLSL